MVSVQFSSLSGNGFSTVFISFREWFQYSSLLPYGKVSAGFFGPSSNEFSPPSWFSYSSFLLSQGMILVVFFSFRDVLVQFSSPSGNGFSAILFFFRQGMVSMQFSILQGMVSMQFSIIQGMVSAQFSSSSGNGFSLSLIHI